VRNLLDPLQPGFHYVFLVNQLVSQGTIGSINHLPVLPAAPAAQAQACQYTPPATHPALPASFGQLSLAESVQGLGYRYGASVTPHA
jgi:hypothetical protein